VDETLRLWSCRPGEADGVQQQEQDITAQRVAENDALFRRSNERIASVAAKIEAIEDHDLLPFLCECADLGCTEILRLRPAEYEAVRANPIRFINAHGHHVSAQGWARVVDEHERYSVVEKIGTAAEIAAALDPRAAE
jgi:hypothetical protein